MTAPDPGVTARRAAIAFVLFTIVLDSLALGIVIPVLPRLVVDFQGGDTATGAEIYGVFGTVWALMQFAFSPVLGALSDRYGRRPVILLSNFGLGLDYILMALALLRSHRELLGLGTVSFLRNIAHDVLPSTFVLYASYRYGWGMPSMGLTLAAVGVCGMIVSGGLVRAIVARFGERRTLLAGLFFGAVGFATYGVAATGAWFALGVPLQALWGLDNPAAQGLMSRRVDPSEQGQLQGALGSLRGITGMIGPALFTFTFAHFIGEGTRWHLPGAPFLLAALLLASALAVAWRVTRAEKLPNGAGVG
jgi:MFS family permease